MKPVSDWRRVVARSISWWMLIAGIVLMIGPELWFHWTGQDYNPFLFWWLGMGCLVAGAAGRLFRQDLPLGAEWLRIAAIGAIIVALALLFSGEVRAEQATQAETLKIAVPLIAKWEGERLIAYQDVAGVWTICFGSTRGVHAGMRKTHAECRALLRREVAEHRRGLHRYFTFATIDRRLPPTRDAAYTSTAYNCGVTAIGHSTAVRRLNAGNIIGGCHALTWWKKAGGRVMRGLFARRKDEEAKCLIGTR